MQDKRNHHNREQHHGKHSAVFLLISRHLGRIGQILIIRIFLILISQQQQQQEAAAAAAAAGSRVSSSPTSEFVFALGVLFKFK